MVCNIFVGVILHLDDCTSPPAVAPELIQKPTFYSSVTNSPIFPWLDSGSGEHGYRGIRPSHISRKRSRRACQSMLLDLPAIGCLALRFLHTEPNFGGVDFCHFRLVDVKSTL